MKKYSSVLRKHSSLLLAESTEMRKHSSLLLAESTEMRKQSGIFRKQTGILLAESTEMRKQLSIFRKQTGILLTKSTKMRKQIGILADSTGRAQDSPTSASGCWGWQLLHLQRSRSGGFLRWRSASKPLFCEERSLERGQSVLCI
ncbi:MAG: hypothetical protein V7L29_17490 [Nostoc sp.]|uniref:hypothetical protein n=1 Tax=Nostoc sp. TaxID=1180 RepID=UPI002FF9A10E